MSPEQVRGEQVDARTDVFALGAVLYECVSGQPAFLGPTPAAVLAKVLFHAPADLEEVVPDCPRAEAGVAVGLWDRWTRRVA